MDAQFTILFSSCRHGQIQRIPRNDSISYRESFNYKYNSSQIVKTYFTNHHLSETEFLLKLSITVKI